KLLFLSLLFILTFVALAQDSYSQSAPEQTQAAQNRSTEMVVMRDGVKLATDIFLPTGKGSWPVVLMRTPYNKASMGAQAKQWTDNGYVFVVQDCRGKFKSEGKYFPFMDDHLDGYDTVEWSAKQSWSNGK